MDRNPFYEFVKFLKDWKNCYDDFDEGKFVIIDPEKPTMYEEIKMHKKDELTILKSRVLDAAKNSKCADVRDTLKALFPEVFETNKNVIIKRLEYIHPGAYCWHNSDSRLCDINGLDSAILIGKGLTLENLSEKCFILHNHYNWKLEPNTLDDGNIDSNYSLRLVPERRI